MRQAAVRHLPIDPMPLPRLLKKLARVIGVVAVAGTWVGCLLKNPPTGSETTSRAPASPPPAAANGPAPSFCRALSKTGDWASSRIWYGSDGKLRYASDSENNRIPDFSYAGYRYGETDPPEVPVVSTLDAAPGDATQRIQDELDAIGARSLGADGFRGALLLRPG